jgi:hypothetical protein
VSVAGAACAYGVRVYATKVINEAAKGKKKKYGLNGGQADALRHCLAACLVRKLCGCGAYNSIVLDHEVDGAWWAQGKWNDIYSPQDLANDEMGRKCAMSTMGTSNKCEDCCMNRLKADKLYILPRKWW